MATHRERPPLLTLTPRAIEQTHKLLESRGKPSLGIRLSVRTRGCSGYSYTLEYADDQSPLDEIVEAEGIKLLIDPKSVMFFIGCQMDFIQEKMKSGFILQIPMRKVDVAVESLFMSNIHNPFILLGMEQKYRINLEELTEKYITKQREYHPDMHVTASPEQKLQTSSMAIALNHAFETLKDPFQRGISLLVLRGVEIDPHKSDHNHQILTQVMADQERLGQIPTREDLERFSTECETRFKEMENNLELAFEGTDNDLAMGYLNSLKYLLKLKADLDRNRRFLK